MKTMVGKFLIPFALILAGTAFAQTDEKLSFEVASVKKAEPPQFGGKGVFAIGSRGGPGTSDPGQITWSGATLKNLLMTAYDVKSYQVSGPGLLDTERYDIVAKVPAGATKEQVKAMWRNLLAERFGVALHRISKTFQVDEMMAAKGGVKLKETTLDPKAVASGNTEEPAPGLSVSVGPLAGPPPEPGGGRPLGPPSGGPPPGGPPPGAPKLDQNGIPQLTRPGLVMMMRMGPSGPSARMVGKAQTMADLARTLDAQLNHPVLDKTGLTGKYDFVIEFAPDFRGGGGFLPGGGIGIGPGPGPVGGGDASQSPDPPEPAGATLVAALQKQLGLKLVSVKAQLDVLVIDKAEKEPTDN